MIFEFDDFGCDHIISDMCQSHDCRDQLKRIKEVCPDFKVTLFAIPAEMTMELLGWCQQNKDWVQLGVHGFFHSSNYECHKMTYDDFDFMMRAFGAILDKNFVKVFRAPGWQISDGALEWLADHNWIVADQSYNDDRRPLNLRSYVYNDNTKTFRIAGATVDAFHGHVWNCMGNGIYEAYDQIMSLASEAKEFKFITEYFE